MKVFPEDFGAVGDGVTDDADAFKAMGAQLRQEPLQPAIIECRTGAVYANSQQNWLSAVLDFEIHGNGATFTTPDGYTFGMNNGVVQQDPFSSWTVANPDDIKRIENKHYGARFLTALPGSTTVSLTADGLARAQDGYLRPGLCMLFSDTKQTGGQPPNPAVWEWNYILKIVGEDVTLQYPTKYEYRDDHITVFTTPGVEDPERTSWGPAKIVSFEGEKDGGTYYYGRKLHYKNLTFLPNGNKGYADIAGLDVRYENCVFDFGATDWALNGSAPSLSRLFVHKNCIWKPNANGVWNVIEIDKLIGKYICADTTAGGISGATGVQTCLLRNSRFVDKSINSSADYTEIDGCVVVSDGGNIANVAAPYTGGGGVVRNTIGVAKGGISRLVPGLPTRQPNREFLVEQVGAGGELLWNYEGPQGKAIAAVLGKGGQLMMTNDGSNFGLVDRVSDLGGGIGAIHAKMQAPANPGDVFHVHHSWRNFVDGGGNIVYAGQAGIANRVSGTQYFAERNKITEYKYGVEGIRIFNGSTKKSRVWMSTLYGWVDRIEIDVAKDYQGSVSNSGNSLKFYGGRPDQTFVQLGYVDLTVLGKRVFGLEDCVLLGNDSVDLLELQKFWAAFHITGQSGSTDWPDEGLTVLPVVSINARVRGVNL